MKEKSTTSFPKSSAGSLMTDSVPTTLSDSTIGSLEKYLLINTRNIQSINYVYVLGKNGVLNGVISIKEIFRQPKNKRVDEVMIKDLVIAHPHTSQERVAYLALKHNIKAIPVVDKENKFLGVVLSDDILRIIYSEAQEDISHFAGVPNHVSVNIDDVTSLPLLVSLKHRLPWLIIGLLGGLLAARVIGLFENILAANIILAAFIPLVVYMASAVGTQVGFFIIRDLAIHSKINFLVYIWRQLKIILLIGVIISLTVWGITWVVYSDAMIAFVLGVAMFLAILSSIITGLFIPYAFSRLSLDPANASGPIATIIQDLMSVTIYLLVASSLL
ncbi:MAG: magnesium transporter [Patescibacteria group bacterium]|jgi:magnesium transporter